jgi:hypothetical protein
MQSAGPAQFARWLLGALPRLGISSRRRLLVSRGQWLACAFRRFASVFSAHDPVRKPMTIFRDHARTGERIFSALSSVHRGPQDSDAIAPRERFRLASLRHNSGTTDVRKNKAVKSNYPQRMTYPQ